MLCAGGRASTSWADIYIGLCEIVALEQQWFLARGRQRIGEAIAIIEPGRMPAPAEAPPRAARQVGLLGVHSNDLDLRAVQPQIEFPTSGIAKARLDYDGRFEECGGRHN